MTTPFDSLPALSGYADTPDENPLSNGGRFVTVGATALRRATGRIQPQPGGTEGYALWTPQFFTDFAITWVLGDVGGFSLELRARATSDGDTSYYEAHVDNAGAVGNYAIKKRVGGGTVTTLSSVVGPEPDVFDRIGFATVGTELSLWYQLHTSSAGHPGYGPTPLDSGWTEVLTATDADLTEGYFVLGLGGLVAAVYQASGAGLFPLDGGGGTLAPAAPYFDVNIRIA